MSLRWRSPQRHLELRCRKRAARIAGVRPPARGGADRRGGCGHALAPAAPTLLGRGGSHRATAQCYASSLQLFAPNGN
eukprot:9495103-Pyramimonas_sp.AAC.1